MLRTRKWIGLTLGLVAVVVAFGALSYWQWQRAQSDRAVQPVQPASDVFVTGQPLDATSYGARVSVTGSYDVARQVLVSRGPSTYWVVTPLSSADGRTYPVARAVVTSVQDPAVLDITPGVLTVVGVAQPFDGDPGGATATAPGVADRLTASSLGSPGASGWIAMQSQAPAPAVAAAPVTPPFGGASTAPLRLQNASYAVQWVIFAGFALFFWWRMLRDDVDARDDLGAPSPRQSAAPVREVY
jgi:cytochrome oxidase assembly protein ShyY1